MTTTSAENEVIIPAGDAESGTSSSEAAAPTEATVSPGGEPAMEEEEEEAGGKGKNKKCCSALRFGGNAEAQGYTLMTVARGGIIMSNIIFSSALIRLASESVGCVFYDNDDTIETPECSARAYGFRPTSLITMIAVVSGILSAFLLPIIGAIVDYTPHRRAVGILSAIFITTVQGVQIWLTTTTWFPMAILQAINGFMYMVQVLAVYAYLPDIGRGVGPSKMMWFSAVFTMCQFGSQVTYLVVNIGLQLGFKLGGVAAAQWSQTFCVVWLLLTFAPGWMKMPSVPALHSNPEGRNLAVIGFAQNWKTLKGIHRHYKRGLWLYFLACVFAEAGANAFTVVAVTFMVEVLGMDTTQVTIIFLVTLLSSIPGAKFGQLIAKKTNPIISWKINLVVFSAVTAAGAFTLTGPSRQNLCYVFGVLWGVLLGWFYPLENVIFTLSVPKGQESELSGFYTYCRSIMTWCPPLIFTVMNEAGLHMKWGMLSLVIFLVAGLVLLQLMAPWEDVLEAAKVNKMTEIVFVDATSKDSRQDI
mmetsp:Transcript_17058/g.36857  ORF Transcript_17058/g.36857 Transcript_17058/m.36857 type:complete len:530 (+) Transcript_17058:80-1669(+)